MLDFATGEVRFKRETDDETLVQRLKTFGRTLIKRTQQTSTPEKTTPMVKKPGRKVGRNDPCPCGSGKKHKKCCLPGAS
jgi:preprotein translocase subunit SecA